LRVGPLFPVLADPFLDLVVRLFLDLVVPQFALGRFVDGWAIVVFNWPMWAS